MLTKTDKRRIDVMLSSTTRDLPEHREQAINGVLRKPDMRPLIMETLTASLKDAIDASIDLVDQAEIYIGVFGNRYGYIPDDPLRNPDRKSITEIEYRHAMKRGIPVLIFIMSDDHPLPADEEMRRDFIEPSQEGKQKLAALKTELMQNHVVGFFGSAKDLRGEIVQALNDPDVMEHAYTLMGTDGNDFAFDAHDDRRLPEPPDFYADPPYTLTTEFVGRADELRRLDAWADSPDPVMVVEAIGGMGKSAVTWQWVQEHALEDSSYDGVMWWSFYEGGATMKAFVRHALAYITHQSPDALKANDMRENFKQLRLELANQRILLVLDGLERVLVAYHRWDAAQMRDDTVQEAEATIKDRDIRACTDPKDDEILNGLLACDTSKILLSSRLIPLALEDRMGNLSKGVAHIHLNGLHPDDALTLVQQAGVKIHDVSSFTRFMGQFGYHSLLVKLVAGRVNRFRRGRGNFDAWYESEGNHLTVADFDVRQHQTHILQYALDSLDNIQMQFLSQIAAFGDALPYETLAIFNPFVEPEPQPPREYTPSGEIVVNWQNTTYCVEKDSYDIYQKSNAYRKGLSQFDELLTELEERGLLRWDREKDTYDMHPVVRGFAFARLQGDSKITSFERIRRYYEAQPADDIESAQEVADLHNSIVVYRALIGAEKYDEAAELFLRFRDRLGYNIAAYYTMLELLIALFPNGTHEAPPLTNRKHMASIISTLGAVYYNVGRFDDAQALDGLSIKVRIENDDLPGLLIVLGNCSSHLQVTNQLVLSLRVNEIALAAAITLGDAEQVAMSRLLLMDRYMNFGQWERTEKLYAALQENPFPTTYWQAFVEGNYAQILVRRQMNAEVALDRAAELAEQSENSMVQRQVIGLRGDVALQNGAYEGAIRYFEESIQLRRKAGAHDVGVPMSGLARAYAHQGDYQRAKQIAAMDELDRDDSSIAEVYLLSGDHEKARQQAILTYQAAWGDGPPYSWWRHLELAKSVLDALGEPYPEMPPFDESKVGKYPHQDEVEAFIDRMQQHSSQTKSDHE